MMEGVIRLDMNEVPYPPPQRIIEAAQRGLSSLNRYADPENLEYLRRLLANYACVSRNHVILGAGSNLLLREVIHIFSKGRKVVMVSPSFLPTVEAVKQFAIKSVSIRLSPPDYSLNPEMLMKTVKEPTLVLIDNPNNPTGKILLDRATMETLTQNPDIFTVIDEAYYEFSQVTFSNLVHDRPNLAITRTMDKAFSLAGARVGYIIAGEGFLNAFSSYDSFLPQCSLYAAIEALNNLSYVKQNVRRIVEERERVLRKLDTLGAHVYSSRANFFLMKVELPGIARRLRDMGVLVSDLSGQLSPGFIRVSVGTREENDVFLDSYTKILEEEGSKRLFSTNHTNHA
jgi:histidinol-phosphate aminotransferase